MGAICACACGGGVGGGEVVRRSDRGDDVRSGGEQSLLRINHAPGAGTAHAAAESRPVTIWLQTWGVVVGTSTRSPGLLS